MLGFLTNIFPESGTVPGTHKEIEKMSLTEANFIHIYVFIYACVYINSQM